MGQLELFIEDYKIPKPLSKVEMNKLIEEKNKGDERAKKLLIEHNIRLVLYVVNKIQDPYYEKEDLVSIGIIALIKAVNTFDTSKNIEFSSYATKCISNALFSHFHQNNKHKIVDSLDRKIYDIEYDNETTIKDTLYDDYNLTEDIENKQNILIVRALTEKLSPREKEIVMLYFGFDNNEQHNLQAIANKLSVSKAYVGNTLNTALKKIRLELKKAGIVEKECKIYLTKKRTLNT